MFINDLDIYRRKMVQYNIVVCNGSVIQCCKVFLFLYL